MVFDDDGYEGRTEPDCTTCSDTGSVWVTATGDIRWPWDDEHGRLTETNCPDCNPTAQQRAAREAEAQQAREEFARAVATGEITLDDWPPF